MIRFRCRSGMQQSNRGRLSSSYNVLETAELSPPSIRVVASTPLPVPENQSSTGVGATRLDETGEAQQDSKTQS